MTRPVSFFRLSNNYIGTVQEKVAGGNICPETRIVGLPCSKCLSSGCWEQDKVCTEAEEDCPDPTGEEHLASVGCKVESEVQTVKEKNQENARKLQLRKP